MRVGLAGCEGMEPGGKLWKQIWSAYLSTEDSVRISCGSGASPNGRRVPGCATVIVLLCLGSGSDKQNGPESLIWRVPSRFWGFALRGFASDLLMRIRLHSCATFCYVCRTIKIVGHQCHAVPHRDDCPRSALLETRPSPYMLEELAMPHEIGFGRKAALTAIAILAILLLLVRPSHEKEHNVDAKREVASAPLPPAPPVPTPMSEPTVEVETLPAMASSAQLDLVNEVLESGLTAPTAYAIRSRHHRRAYYIAARIDGPGLGNDTYGVWLISGDRDSPGMILSVNLMAAEFSAPRMARDTDAGGSASDPEARTVLRYAKQ